MILTGRSTITTTLNTARLGGEYLLDWNGDYILDWQNERIGVIIPGGRLSITTLTGRTPPTVDYPLDIGNGTYLKIDDINFLLIQDSDIRTIMTGRIIPP